jgi:hypothetical protein
MYWSLDLILWQDSGASIARAMIRIANALWHLMQLRSSRLSLRAVGRERVRLDPRALNSAVESLSTAP